MRLFIIVVRNISRLVSAQVTFCVGGCSDTRLEASNNENNLSNNLYVCNVIYVAQFVRFRCPPPTGNDNFRLSWPSQRLQVSVGQPVCLVQLVVFRLQDNKLVVQLQVQVQIPWDKKSTSDT